MTREEARKAAEVMLAYANGAEIEWKDRDEGSSYAFWHVDKQYPDPDFEWNTSDYRVKSTPRPYASMTEFMEAEKEHGPWLLRDCDHSGADKVLHVSNQGVRFLNYAKSFEDLFNDFEWQDGTPCGVLED